MVVQPLNSSFVSTVNMLNATDQFIEKTKLHNVFHCLMSTQAHISDDGPLLEAEFTTL